MWVRQPAGCDQGADETNCQAIPEGSTVPATPASGSPEWRGWWIWVPSTYDNTKPTHVVWNFAGCDDQDIFDAGNASFNFDKDVANANTIMVGLDYDTYTDVPLCYDNRNPNSNDFIFFPWLKTHIENEFCVDTNHEFLTGYSSGGWVMQQMNCKFPTLIRASAAVTGCEPGTPADPGGSQPTCDATGKQAVFYVHDTGDTTNPYACILPGCTRMLKQNGCTVTDCSDPTSPTLTTAYAPPAGVTLPQGTQCRQFNGCPTDYPVVFCTTVNQPHSQNDTNWGVDKMFWDWFVNRLN
jgi:poly(3-hydroxybutyrate) depolymerase